MGKESRLRSKPDTGTRLAYSNGDRKLYEKDACPPGCDEVIWRLALFYRDMSESYGYQAEGVPILYQEIYEKGLTDPLLGAIIDSGPRPPQDLIEASEAVISLWFNEYNSDSHPRIGDFIWNFPYLKALNMEREHSYLLKSEGTRTPQEVKTQPDRRSDWEKTRAVIISSVIDEEAAWSKAEAFVNEILGG